MILQSTRELEVTREKLRGLEKLYAEIQSAPTDNAYARELTLRSLHHTMNQLKEDIARFQARTGLSSPSA